jgi:hypothetical protein
MDSRQQPSQSSRSQRQSGQPKDIYDKAGLNLSSLPRFHPATYNSGSSSRSTTPSSNGSSAQPPMSPRSHQRQLSEAQKQLMSYQRELLSHAARGQSSRMLKPENPKLVPLTGGPGPVTPLELEGEGYLTAGAASNQSNASDIEKMIREEGQRRGEMPPRQQPSYSTA